MNTQPSNPLHGKTLKSILEYLVDYYGWEVLGTEIKINCFLKDPSIKSSLTFLRKTEWARKKVENLYLETIDNTKPVRELNGISYTNKLTNAWRAS